MGKQHVLNIMGICVCVYSCLSYLARKARAPCYIVVRGPSGSTIFQHYLTNCVVFGEGLLNIKMCGLIFSPSFI